MNLSLDRSVALLIPCALVLVLAWKERGVRSDPSPPARFLTAAALVTLVSCLLVVLPGANDVAKPAFPVFLTLSVAAGLAVSDTVTARRGGARIAAAAAWILLFALPVNAIAFLGAYATPDRVEVAPGERAAAAWVREHTSRQAVFIDEPERVFLVVTGPRRYLFGSWNYASQWGYPRAEMAGRHHAVGSLYDTEPLDAAALKELAEAPDPLYVIVRPERCAEGAAVRVREDLFPRVFEGGGIQVHEVDRDACRKALPLAPPAPTDEELIRASGL